MGHRINLHKNQVGFHETTSIHFNNANPQEEENIVYRAILVHCEIMS